MRYIIKVCDCKQTYYFYPSSYGVIMSSDPWRAFSASFKTVEEAKKFFNEEQESFNRLFSSCNIVAINIMEAEISTNDICNL